MLRTLCLRTRTTARQPNIDHQASHLLRRPNTSLFARASSGFTSSGRTSSISGTSLFGRRISFTNSHFHTPTAVMAPTIDVKSLTGNPDSPEATRNIQSQLVDILDPAMNSADFTAGVVADSIDKLYTSQYNSDDKAEEFIWTLWSLYVDIVKQVPADDSRLDLLATVVEKLKAKSSGTVQIWRQETKVWGDLPLLGGVMRDAWNFSPSYDGSEKDKAIVRSWLSVNSFAARLVGSSTEDWTNFAIWSLRDALEQDGASAAAQDGGVAIAHEWIVHAGKVLLEKSRTGGELSKVDRNALAAGKLFDGEPGLTVERWNFWKQRLETLAKGDGDADAKASAQTAVDTMNTLEG